MVPFTYRRAPGTLVRVVQRLLEGLLTAWAAVTFTFFALRVAAGDPLASLLAQGLASTEQVEGLRRALGLDRPLAYQYGEFLSGLLRGDLGASLYTGRPIRTMILEQLPHTAELALTALALGLLLGLMIGGIAAWRERRPEGLLAANLASMATALPVAFTGIVIIFLFTHVARAFPALGLGHWEELALPAMVLGFAVSGAIARVVYSSLSESLHAPHLLAARARGLGSSWRILWHALRPALPPVVSLTALEAAFLFGGTVITETVFSRPGLGRLLVGAILQGDFPVAQGLVVLGALTYTATGIGADLLATLLDPRLQVDR